MKNLLTAALVLIIVGCKSNAIPEAFDNKLKVATFNVSMEASNYVQGEAIKKGPQVLMELLAKGEHPQIHNIAEIIQRTRPDVILLNEFDYIDSPQLGVKAFINNFLSKPHGDAQPIDYPYVFVGPSNTGLPTTFDLDNNGKVEGFGADAQGFGQYYGHYGMALLSRYPIDYQHIRTFAQFRWADMPQALAPVYPDTQKPFYEPQEWQSLRLSSKSHWDVPVMVNDKTLHVLVSHPTPPVFDGPDDHNGARNHDEVRFWHDYIRPQHASYIYDDRGVYGGLAANSAFVIMGDQNAATDGGNARKEAIRALLTSPLVNQTFIPQSEGGKENKPDVNGSQYHTSGWGMRVDYVIPSYQLNVINGGVFWPAKDDALYRLVKDRKSSSDHRLVWLEVGF